jgi:hypothetical protein
MAYFSPISATPMSASIPDFEQLAWREAVEVFKMTSNHRKERLNEFTKLSSSPQAAMQNCRDLQRDASTQYGKVLSKILGKIEIFINAGNLAVKGAPESVGLAWTGIQLALGSIQDDFATFQLFSGACVDIIGILVSCRVFSRMFDVPTGPEEFVEVQQQVKGSIPKVYQQILEFSYQMTKHMDRSKAS